MLWIIVPLLHAAGYSSTDIVLESPDSTLQRPDLTLLPGTDKEWYLEAKACTKSLDPDKNLIQACNYATTRAQRWVVLTNGLVWRVYDAHYVQAEPADRLVAEARLNQTEDMVRFLTEISKEHMLAGGLVAFTTRARLAAHLTRALKDPQSPEIGLLCRQIRKHPMLTGATREAVAAYFKDLQPVPSPAGNGESDGRGHPPNGPAPKPPLNPVQGTYTLSDLGSKDEALPIRTRPRSIRFPDGTLKEAKTWRYVACRFLEWLDSRNQLPPIPFTAAKHGRMYFVNTTDQHLSGPMRGPVRLILGGRTVYLEGNRSAQNIVRSLCQLCAGAGVSPDEVMIEFESAASDG